jgi:hypothetical protein
MRFPRQFLSGVPLLTALSACADSSPRAPRLISPAFPPVPTIQTGGGNRKTRGMMVMMMMTTSRRIYTRLLVQSVLMSMFKLPCDSMVGLQASQYVTLPITGSPPTPSPRAPSRAADLEVVMDTTDFVVCASSTGQTVASAVDHACVDSLPTHLTRRTIFARHMRKRVARRRGGRR